MRFGNLLTMLAAAAIVAAISTEAWRLSVAYDDVRACRNALPALEDTGELIVGALRRDPDLPSVYEVDYWVKGLVARPGRLRCAFGEGSDGERRMLGAEIGGWSIGEARLYMLERFWLGDPEAVREGERRIRDVIPLRELLRAVVGRPDPSLLAAVVCGLLALLAAGLGRRRETAPEG